MSASHAPAGSAPAGYFIPEPSSWPVKGSIALFCMAIGAATWFNGMLPGPWLVAFGFAMLVYVLYGWFGTVVVLVTTNGTEANHQNRFFDR